MTNLVGRNALHSIDSGNHTCSVTDYTGRVGSATVQIVLSGMRVVLIYGHSVLLYEVK